MAAKRRPRKPLRSELSDGIRKTRRSRPIKTVAPQQAPPKKKEEVEVVPEPVIVMPAVVEEAVEELLEPVVEVAEDPSEEELEEQRIRDLAKDLGITNWWNKKVETLRLEIEELESETGEEE